MTSSLMLSHYFTINTFAFEESVRSALSSCRQTRAELLYVDMSAAVKGRADKKRHVLSKYVLLRERVT